MLKTIVPLHIFMLTHFKISLMNRNFKGKHKFEMFCNIIKVVISAVKQRLIVSKIKVFVYIIYVCILCYIYIY